MKYVRKFGSKTAIIQAKAYRTLRRRFNPLLTFEEADKQGRDIPCPLCGTKHIGCRWCTFNKFETAINQGCVALLRKHGATPAHRVVLNTDSVTWWHNHLAREFFRAVTRFLEEFEEVA